jgi:hypothetical protein
VDDLNALSHDQLLDELKSAQAELEDLEEVRFFTLGQTGVHIGAGQLKTLHNTWNRDEARLRQRAWTPSRL